MVKIRHVTRKITVSRHQVMIMSSRGLNAGGDDITSTSCFTASGPSRNRSPAPLINIAIMKGWTSVSTFDIVRETGDVGEAAWRIVFEETHKLMYIRPIGGFLIDRKQHTTGMQRRITHYPSMR